MLAEEKDRRVRVNIICAYLIKGAAIIVGVLTIRAYMAFFSDHALLGVWYTILAILSWILNFDLGISNGLRNMLAKAFSDNDMEYAKELISTGYVVLAPVCIVIAAAGCLLIAWVDWNSFFNIDASTVGSSVLRFTIFVSFAGIVLQLYMKIVSSVLNAMEKTALTSLLSLLTNIGILLFVSFFHAGSEQERLIALSVAYLCAAVLPYAFATLLVFTRSLSGARPAVSCANMKLARDIVGLGGRFLLVQVSLMAITVTNEIYITWLFDASDVVEFQVYNKVFSTILALYAIISSPIWSAVTKSWHERNIDWIRNAQAKLTKLSIATTLLTILFCVVLQPVFDIWLGSESVSVSLAAEVSFCLYTITMLFAYSIATVANGISMLGVQMVCYIGAAIVKYPLCLALAGAFESWTVVVLANAIIMIPYLIVQPIALGKALNRRSLEISQ